MSAVIASVLAAESSGTSNQLTVTASAGATVGDVLAVIAFAANGTVLSTATTGWTKQKEIGLGNGVMALFDTNTVAGNMVVDSSTFQDLSVVYLRITGGDYASIVYGDGAEANSDNIPVPSIVIPEASCLEIIGAGNDSSRAQTTPSGFSIAANNVGNNNISAFEKLSSAGATGVRDVAISASRRNAGLSFAVPAASTGGTISADTGAFVLAGQTADFIGAFVIDAATGAFTVSGQTADFIAGSNIDAATGSFAITGNAADFISGTILDAATGAFTITGQPATFVAPVAGVINADTGAFTVSGQAATFLSAAILDADTGAFVLAGQPAVFTVGARLDAGTGSFTLSGQSVDFITQSIISAETGSFTITGQSVEIGSANAERVFALSGQIRKDFIASGIQRDSFTLSGQIRPAFKF